jgi:hypothetical protein
LKKELHIRHLSPATSKDEQRGGVLGWFKRHPVLVVLGIYLVVFGLFFWQVRVGFGQYWDWSFPYFRDQIPNIFSNKDSSWTAAGGGSPLNYASDYFFRFLVSLFFFLPPEILHYLLLVVLFAAGASGVYLLARTHTSRGFAFLLGLLAWVNPAIFYKYTAGHLNYFVSFVLLIYLIYFLLHHFQKDLRSSVVVGLFYAFIGTQIQFFIITGIFLLAYFLFHREKISWKYLGVMLGLPLLINLVWLCNFITGAVDTAQTGAQAAKVSFKASSASSFLSIFTFSFSKATLLSRFYAFYELLWNATLYIFLLWLLARGSGKRKERFDLVLLVSLAVMMFMATGMYQVLNIYPLSVFYPMLREVGHFAPVIVLLALLLIARSVEQTRWRWALLLVVCGSLFMVGVKFEYFSQKVHFAEARAAFQPFKEIADKDAGDYRVLTYPFFDKYVLKDEPADKPGDLPLKNSGHDSFAAFASQAFVQNAVAPYQFQDSPQYKLLQSYDVDVLRPLGVKYIFDFQNIYESDYNLYVPAATYNNDLRLIKNDPHFLDKLVAHNPGRVKRVNKHVVELTNPLPRFSVLPRVFGADEDAQYAQLAGEQVFTRQQLRQAFDYASDRTLAPYTTLVSQLFASPMHTKLDKQKGTFSQTVQSGKGATLYSNQSYRDLSYQATNTQLTIRAQTAPPLKVNGQVIGATNAGQQVVATVPLTPSTPYYVSVGGVISRIKPGQSGQLGGGKAGQEIQILRGQGGNLISNSSFEHNLWEARVGDCNNYDGNGAVGMQRDTSTASEGQASLRLSATRHDACTSAQVHLAKNAQYLLSFDYQSDNASTASFFMSGKDDPLPLARGSRAVVDHAWHSTTSLLQTSAQAGTARLFLYALEGDGRTATINRYDNVELTQLLPLSTVRIPSGGPVYAKTALAPGKQDFSFTDPNYHFTNLIANSSFEKGSWQPKAGDCNAYDSFPKIGMQLDTQDKTDGNASLRLSATHHDACVHATANVRPGANYLLAFDYKTTGTKAYGYTVSFDNPGATLSRNQLESKQSGWHTARQVLSVPEGASTLTLYLYAFEANGHSESIVHYDNVSLAELPDFTDRFFVAQAAAKPLDHPKVTATSMQSQSVRTMRVAAAKGPFFVALSETYHPRWRLELDSGSTLLPGGAAQVAGITHTTLSGAINGWLVDPAALCTANGHVRSGCTQRADGSYDIRLRAEFVPARWFRVAAFTSWTTVIAGAAYLILVHPKMLPTYRTYRKRRA